MRNWFEVKNRAGQTPELWVYDDIARADQFIAALKALGNVSQIDLHINSRGGDPFAAAAMYLALKRHPAKIIAFNDGLAASAASVVLMAGDKIVMAENTLLMVHDPIGGVLGTAEDMREFADAMDKIKATILTAYRRSRKTDEELAEIMSNETWYNAQEALENGFIDEISDEIPVAAFFDLSNFQKAPQALRDKFQPVADPPADSFNRATAAKICEVCKEFGASADRAGEFISSRKTVDEIRAELAAERTAATETAKAEALEVYSECARAGLPELMSEFASGKMTAAEVKARVANAAGIRAACKIAERALGPELTARRGQVYISAGFTAEEASRHILSMMHAVDSIQIDSTLTPQVVMNQKPLGQGERVINYGEIYARYRKRDGSGWREKTS
jgi:ATP-dependent protease ClpP protease subunit